MSHTNYQNYYQYCLQKYKEEHEKYAKVRESKGAKVNELNETKDLTKFQFDEMKDSSPIIGAIGYQLIQCDLLNSIKDNAFNADSFKACLEIDKDNLLNIDSFAHSHLRMYNFNCEFDLHRAYLIQNQPVIDGQADDINCDVYHWKNEPKTIITFYINLEYYNREPNRKPFMKVLYNPTYDKHITMRSNRHGEDEWGANTHLRYKDCKLHDGQVQEFKAMGFVEKEVSSPVVVLGNNVIHKHILEPETKLLVLKYRPTHQLPKTYEDVIEAVGGIFDYSVSPCPYN